MAVFVASAGHRSPAGLLLAPWIREETIDVDTYELFQRGSELLAAGHAHQAVIALERARDRRPRKHGSVRRSARPRLLRRRPDLRRRGRVLPGPGDRPQQRLRPLGLGLRLARDGRRARAIGHLRLAVVMRPEVDTYRQASTGSSASAPATTGAGAGETRGGRPGGRG